MELKTLTIPLPAIPHVPGRNPRPTEGAFLSIARNAPNPTDPALWRDNKAWTHGFDLFRAGFYWETHEVWEPVWMHARPNSPERVLVQGLIHVANACLKQGMARPRAALRLAHLAVACLGDAATGGPRLMGMDPRATRAEIEAFRERLASAAAGDFAVEPPLLGFPVD